MSFIPEEATSGGMDQCQDVIEATSGGMDQCPDMMEDTSKEITQPLQFHDRMTKDQQRRIDELEKKLAEQESTISSLRGMKRKRTRDASDHARRMFTLNSKEELKKKVARLEDTISSLHRKESQCSQEVADAQNTAAQIVGAMHSGQANWLIDEALGGTNHSDGRAWRPWSKHLHHPSVGLKMIGSIDESLWRRVCRETFKTDVDWAARMRRSLSKWEDLVRDIYFQPFRLVPTGSCFWKREIDHRDVQLMSLRKEFGEVLYHSVTTALMELEEWNPASRSPVLVIWDFVNSRKASLKQMIAYFGTALNALASSSSPRKRLRN